MLTLSLLIAMPFQDDAKVTIDLPISPLPVVLKQLESQTGNSYHVSGPNRDQQIFIRVKDMPSARLRQAIAKATDGTWSVSGGAYYLATKNDLTLKEASFRKSISAWFAKQKPVGAMNHAGIEANIKRSVQLAKEAENDEKKMTELYALARTSPNKRLISRALMSIGANEAASLAESERRVYAFNPTVLQKPLPAALGNALAEYRREQAEYIDSVSRIMPPVNDIDEQNGYGGWNPVVDPYRGLTHQPAATMMVALRRTSGTVMYELMLFDAKGKRVGTESGSLRQDAEETDADQDEPGRTVKAFEGLDMPVNLSEDDKAFAKDLTVHLLGRMMTESAADKQPVSETTKQRLLNMDKQDLLTFGPTQMLRQYADVAKKQVVAKVTDLAIFSVAIGTDMEKEATLGSAVSLALGAFGKDFSGYEETDDLITLKPVYSEMLPFPVEMDRRATAQFLRSCARGEDTLEAVAGLAASSESLDDIQLPIFLSLLLGGDSTYLSAMQGFDLIKLYGQLNQTQKMAAKQGELVLSLNNLVGPLAAQTRKILLSGQGGSAGVAMPEGETELTEATMYDMSSSDSYNDEITVKLANLPAAAGRLSISLKSKDELFMRMGMSILGSQAATPMTVASTLVYSEQNPNEPYLKLSGFSYGQQKTLSARITFGTENIYTNNLKIPVFSKDSKVLKLTDLPQDFQKQVAEQLAEYRKQMQGFPPGGASGGIKPP